MDDYYAQGMLRLEPFDGGYYWVALNGTRLLRVKALFGADEMQPGFTEAMEAAGW